ncbi:glycosyltransferase [uncultured Dokdonia sp.]|uniref:glycosyltransferase n=1 Tax=uncultured Dokdonia sp. TaxID=575653 RepID=UPI00260824A8|nr:glycosyltransferase [uncultured Dokdonia sp.]
MEVVLTYLFYAFIGIVAINSSYYLFFFVFAFAKAKKATSSYLPPVSLIVCSKNEAENLRRNIPHWLAQKYAHFEIVLINDASRDETKDVIEEFAELHPSIVQVHVENNEAFWGSKKYALTLGIKKASHDHLLFTDADCTPESAYWIQEMSNHFVGKKELILGYGAYEKIKGSWLNKLIRFETVLTAIQYFSYAIAGRPYMGVGRNLAYTTNLFYEQRGFIDHMKVQSGDDDLFVNQAGTRENVAVNFHPDSFTISTPKKTFGQWYTQKRRHVSTSSHYRFMDKFFLGLFYTSQLLFFVVAILLLAFNYQWEWVAAMIGIRYLFSWIAIGASANKLKEKDVILLYPINELFLLFFQLSIFITNLISKPNRWK